MSNVRINHTFWGVFSVKDILTLPQLVRTLSKEATNCFARSPPYLQLPKSITEINQIIKKYWPLWFSSFKSFSSKFYYISKDQIHKWKLLVGPPTLIASKGLRTCANSSCQVAAALRIEVKSIWCRAPVVRTWVYITTKS